MVLGLGEKVAAPRVWKLTFVNLKKKIGKKFK